VSLVQMQRGFEGEYDDMNGSYIRNTRLGVYLCSLLV
jgi:hypothetical protein